MKVVASKRKIWPFNAAKVGDYSYLNAFKFQCCSNCPYHFWAVFIGLQMTSWFIRPYYLSSFLNSLVNMLFCPLLTLYLHGCNRRYMPYKFWIFLKKFRIISVCHVKLHRIPPSVYPLPTAYTLSFLWLHHFLSFE